MPVFNPSTIIGVCIVSAVALLFMVFTLLDGVFRTNLSAEQKKRACTQYLIDFWGYKYQPVPKMEKGIPTCSGGGADDPEPRNAVDPSTVLGL